jgi:hypothetical protein
MRYILLTDIGGFLWWLVFKFCRTKLEDEQKAENWARNIFILIVFGVLIAIISNKFFN